MTPEPALWNCRSRGLESGGTSKKRRKKGSSSKGLRWPGFSLMVPRVAMFTTAGETRLTMGASEGIGAASAWEGGGAGRAANAPGADRPAASRAAVKKRKIMSCPRVIYPVSGQRTPATQSVGRTARVRPTGRYSRTAILHVRSHSAGFLSRFHPDSLRLHLGYLRNCDLEHPVGRLGLDVLHIGRLRQAEAAQELAGDPLDAAIALA